MFVVSHVSMSASAFLIVFWTLERWLCIVKQSDKLSSPVRRAAAVLMALLFGVVLKCPIYFELQILENPHCHNQARYVVLPSALAQNYVGCHFYSV